MFSSFELLEQFLVFCGANYFVEMDWMQMNLITLFVQLLSRMEKGER